MKQERSALFPIQWLMIAVALLMIVIGVHNGETKTVLAKAIEICLECIGIG